MPLIQSRLLPTWLCLLMVIVSVIHFCGKIYPSQMSSSWIWFYNCPLTIRKSSLSSVDHPYLTHSEWKTFTFAALLKLEVITWVEGQTKPFNLVIRPWSMRGITSCREGIGQKYNITTTAGEKADFLTASHKIQGYGFFSGCFSLPTTSTFYWSQSFHCMFDLSLSKVLNCINKYKPEYPKEDFLFS